MTQDAAPEPFQTPPLAPLAKGLMILQAVYLALTVPLYPVFGLSIGALESLAMVSLLLGGFCALWLFYRYVRQGREAWPERSSVLPAPVRVWTYLGPVSAAA